MSSDVSSGNLCFVQYPVQYGLLAQLADRENIVNFHFAVPRKNGLRDDLQLLYSSSALNSQFYTSPNDAGGYGEYTQSVTGNLYCNPATSLDVTGAACAPTPNVNYPAYTDAVVYNLPFGTPITGKTTQNYFQPSSPQNRAPGAELPANLRDAIYNDTGIVKLQYTHALSDHAYVRAFGYTFFSDWTQAGANSTFNCYQYGVGPTDCGVAANYDLITHTYGGELQFADQINEKNLVQLTGNSTLAHVSRFNNTGFIGGASPIGIVSTSNGFGCWDERPTIKVSGVVQPNPAYDSQVPCSSSHFQSNAAAGPYNSGLIGPNATAAGAQWVTLWDGNARGTLNTVKPKFSFVSLTDSWRPSDKFLFDLGLRYENYTYGLVSAASVATQFYASIVSNDVCVNSAGTVYSTPLKPGQPPPAPTIYTATCPAGYNHPPFTANSPSSYANNYWSPRLSATYTQSPDTVWRASAGRFTEPPISASVQYLNSSGNSLSTWTATLPLGFTSPFHPIPSQSASQYDVSLERHIRGTDVSFKLSPFYNYTVGYQEQAFIGPNFVTQAPVGNFRSMGIEGSVTKGDFSRDGLSGQVSLTYTKAQVQYQPYYGVNQVAALNLAVTEYNKLTSAGGGSPCYKNANDPTNTNAGVGDPVACTPGGTMVRNPYYNLPAQGILGANDWYSPGDTGLSATNNASTTYYDSPWVGSVILNYRKNKFSVTPSFQFVQGGSYGGPLDVVGLDPRTCGQNSTAAGIVTKSPSTDPLQCDYLSQAGTASVAAGNLYVPNPQTGAFAVPGAYRNPWLMVGNIAFSYDISPRLSATLTLANVFHTCFGGSKEPWTNGGAAPSANICSYSPNARYINNYYNGTSPLDTAANGITPQNYQLQSYYPNSGSDAGSLPTPFNAFFQIQVKL